MEPTKVTGTLTDKGLSLVINGDPAAVGKSHMNYGKILQALRDKDYEVIPELINIAQSIQASTNGLVVVRGGVVFYNDIAMRNSLTTRMLQMIDLGLDIEPLARFLENLMQNPSHRAVNELHKFMEACDMPITEDGRLLAYRSVNEDFWDTHTGKTSLSLPPDKIPTYGGLPNGKNVMTHNGVTTDLSTGKCVVSMPRNMVNENPDQTCSDGLHVCSQKYGMYGSRLLLVAVNPADVVSVPNEYNAAKMRVSKYEVLKCVKEEGFKQWGGTPIFSQGAFLVSASLGEDDVEEDDFEFEDDDRDYDYFD